MKSLVEKEGMSDDFFIDSAAIGSWHIGQLPDSVCASVALSMDTVSTATLGNSRSQTSSTSTSSW